jgi:hypothetical protein
MVLLALRAALAVSLLVVAAFGLGNWFQPLFPPNFGALDRFWSILLVGWGILSLILFLVGQVAFNILAISILLGVAAMLGAIPLFHLLQENSRSVSPWQRSWNLPAIIVAIVLGVAAVSGLAEIVGDWGNDTVAYHLLGPKVWLREGIIRPVADNCHTAFPQTAETLYGALLAIGGSRAPSFSSIVPFGLLLLVSASLAIRCGVGSTGAWWVAALSATAPAILIGSVDCFVDGLYAAFILAAIRVGLDAEIRGHWAVFGIFCGLAMATKYTGLVALPILMACAIWMSVAERREAFPSVLKHAATAVAAAGLIAAPYYLRNWILLGSPIYPPAPGLTYLFTPRYLSPEAIASFLKYIHIRGAGLGHGILAFLLLPYNLTFHTANFHGAGGIGVCPLGLGPLGLIIARKGSFTRMMAVIAFISLCAWFVTQQESRFLIPVYIIGMILAVVGWQFAISQSDKVSRTLAAALVTISIAYGLFMIVTSQSGALRAVVSPAYARQRALEETPYLESFEFLNHQPGTGKVLILDRSVAPYFLDKNYIKPIGQWGERTLPGGPSSLEALEQARGLKISHVLDVNSEIAPFQVVGQQNGLKLVFESKNARVYEID